MLRRGDSGGFWHFVVWLQPPASSPAVVGRAARVQELCSLQSSSSGEGGLSSGTLQLPGEKLMLRRGDSGGFWHSVAWLQPPASSLQSSSGGEGGLSSLRGLLVPVLEGEVSSDSTLELFL